MLESAATNGLFIVDITDPESPEFVSRVNSTGASLNNVPFTTFVELHGSTYALSVASAFLTTGAAYGYHGRVMITDVSTPDSSCSGEKSGRRMKRRIQNHSTRHLLPLPPSGSSTYAVVTSASSTESATISIRSSRIFTSN